MTVTLPAVVSFTVRRDDFLAVLNDAALFASSDPGFPAVTCVRVTVTAEGQIRAVATDRFTLGRRDYVLDIASPDTGWSYLGVGPVEILLPKAEVKRIGTLHVRGARGHLPRMLEVTLATLASEERRVTVRSGGDYDARVTSEHRGLDAEFPSVEKFLADAVPTADEAGLTVNPEFLARFAKVSQQSRYHAAMRVQFCGGNRNGGMIRVEIGSQFVGLAMSRRDEK